MRFCSAAGLLVLVFAGGLVRQQSFDPRPATESIPITELQEYKPAARLKVSVCQLKRDPPAFNHRLVEVTGFISHGFEDFSLFDPECPEWEWPGIWLEYGGKAASGTIYCCGASPQRKRPQPLVVEDIPIELVNDARFKLFDKLVQRQPDSVVHATIVGRFFAGVFMDFLARPRWGGYGHMGCCSLLVIQEVASVDPHDSTELDYGAFPDHPELDGSCGGYTILNERPLEKGLLKAQQQADVGQEEWAFTDPKRVATQGLARLLSLSDTSTMELRQTRKMQGRVIYYWWPEGETKSYMVVVSRPYLLSFYAKDPKRVAWVMTAAFERPCGVGK